MNPYNHEPEAGIVIAQRGDSLDVSLVKSEACAKCRACIAGMSKQEMRLFARNLCGAKIGDRVRIELDDGAFLVSSLVMYGFPLIMLLLGFFAGLFLSRAFVYINPEILSLLCGMFSLGLSFLLIRKNEKRFHKTKYQPKAVEIVSRFDDGAFM